MSLNHSCKPLSRIIGEPVLRSTIPVWEANLRDRPPPDGLSIRERPVALDRQESAWENPDRSVPTDSSARQDFVEFVICVRSRFSRCALWSLRTFTSRWKERPQDSRGYGYRYLNLIADIGCDIPSNSTFVSCATRSPPRSTNRLPRSSSA